MPFFRSLLALASLALFALSAAPVHANALAADRAHVPRHGHLPVAKRRRSDTSSTSRCNPRPSSSLPTSTPPPPTSTPPTSASPTSTSPTATSSTASATPSSTSGSKKWGLAWGADSTYLANFASLSRVQYAYDWNADLPSNLGELGLTGMTMLWGSQDTEQFASTAVEGYATIALGFNEPNEPSQANLSAQDAVSLWMEYLEPLRNKGYTLGSPACTNDEAGTIWYQEFFSLLDAAGGHADYLAVHAYNTDAQTIIDYITNLYNSYGLPILITEFADQNFSGQGGQADQNAVWDFAGKMVQFVEDTDWIMMACPFGLVEDLSSLNVNTLNSLITSDGYPTDLGYYYFNGN